VTRKVAVVAHTHWDREWYQSYQYFRRQLVAVLDELLPRLEADAGSGPFLLDGQLAVIDDYLEIRPAAADAIRRLTAAGRLTIGPWYVLMDEFLVSGETIVRDLQLGFATAAAYGGASPVGYLPDMFGHIAQMPQILRQAGLDHAVVWRGVPSTVGCTGFWWRAPDGPSGPSTSRWGTGSEPTCPTIRRRWFGACGPRRSSSRRSSGTLRTRSSS
jgi:mannosylglycerate hydrolase